MTCTVFRSAVWRDRFYWNINVGPTGANIEATNISLKIPQDALDSEVTITLAISWNKADLPRLQDDQRLVGPIIHCLPHGLRFKKPVTLSFDYSHAAVLQGQPNMHVWCR